MIYEKKCPVCGTHFKTTRSSQAFCRKACASKGRPRTQEVTMTPVWSGRKWMADGNVRTALRLVVLFGTATSVVGILMWRRPDWRSIWGNTMTFKKTCLWCGEKFETNNKMQKCCCRNHGANYRNRDLIDAAETDGNTNCPYNDVLICNVHKCGKCGWNPKVAEARLEDYNTSCDLPDDYVFAVLQDHRPMTNADRIRAMSDEELAKIISCPKRLCDKIVIHVDGITDCDACALEWLKQPAEETE